MLSHWCLLYFSEDFNQFPYSATMWMQADATLRRGLHLFRFSNPDVEKNMHQEDRRTLRSPTVRLYKISLRMAWPDPLLNHGFKIFLDVFTEWNEKDVSMSWLGKPWQFSSLATFWTSRFHLWSPDSRAWWLQGALICWFVLGSDERGNGYVSTCREDRTEVGQTWHETRNKRL